MSDMTSGPGVQPRTQGGELVEEHRSNLENSDDDDPEEEIPYVSPSKTKTDPTIRSLDYRKTRDRQLDDQSPQSRQFKRRRIGSAGRSGSSIHSDRAPNPQGENGDSSPDNAHVRAGLLNSINAILRKDTGSSQHGGNQVNGGIQNLDTGYGHAKHGHKHINGQEKQQHIAADTSGDDRISSGSGQEALLEYDHTAQDNHLSGEDQAQVDIWDVPISPEKVRPLKQPGIANSSRGVSRRGRPSKSATSRHCPRPAQSPQLGNLKPAKHLRSTSRSDRAISLASTQPESDKSQSGIPEDFADDETSEFIDGCSQDEENLARNDPPGEGSFAQDVADFESRYPKGFVGDESYLGAAEDDNVTTHLDPSSLRTALQLMRHHAWGGLITGWHQRFFDIDSSDTRSIRTLLELLEKFERLLAVTPKAPRIKEQNKFLKKYSSLVGYYFSEIGSTLKSIRETYQKQESANTKLHSDIISCAIPMLFHVLVSAWELGGRDWRHTMFTISTIDLLGRTIRWIGKLYRPLLKRLVRQPHDSPKDESKAQRVQREKQLELEKYRKDLCRIITESVDALEEEENRQNLERQIQQENLMRQEELLAQQKQEEEAVMMSIRERQRRSLMSIRGIHTPLSESSRPSSRQISTAREVQSQKPRQARPAEIQPSRSDGGDWSREEKVYLFKKLQESYPDIMDLDNVRWELNRTLEETEDMAEEILGLMLEAVHPEQAVADRDAHIHEIMQAYRRTWGHER
ncbi:hypothetical protein F5B19DRAFT_440165 [Rostrohypoxylon terebratum]|nr:hypothetical protein F5B19DRAFT_440165 [Rostrohypoxylon terebratum]